MDILDKSFGELDVDVRLEGGKAILEVATKHASGEAIFIVKQDAKYFLEKLKKLIPGSIDDLIIDVAKNALP